jgi:spore germination protein GerM
VKGRTGFALAVVLALVAGSACRRERQAAPVREATAPPPTTETMAVDLYFPGEGGRLYPERREIAASAEPEDRIARLVEALLAGPEAESLAPPLPPGVEVAALYLSADGIAYLDLKTPEGSALPLAAGSTQERQIVMSLVNSIALNVPEARRVVLLWNGSQPATLAGHLDLTRPVAADPSLVARSSPPREAAE